MICSFGARAHDDIIVIAAEDDVIMHSCRSINGSLSESSGAVHIRCCIQYKCVSIWKGHNWHEQN